MTRSGVAVLLAAALAARAAARPPEECLASPGEREAASAEHAGKTYRFRFPECRTEFLGDPERFAQLYDALLEMQAEGAMPAAAEPASLVPS